MPVTTIGRPRPLKELKAFTKVELREGQEDIVKVVLNKDAFSVYNQVESCWRGLKGALIVQIGFSSQDISTAVSVSVLEEFTWTGV
jgi:beta-glucosidase